MGIDQHKRYSKVVVVDDKCNLIDEERLNHFDKQSMYDYFKSYPSDKTKVVLEEASLQEVILAHPYKTRVIAESKIKTDSIDARLLAQLLRADLIPKSFLASKETRTLREELRYRISLVRIRSCLKCKVHSLLEKEGVVIPPVSDLFGKKGMQWLKNIELPGASCKVVKGYLELIEQLTELINKVDISIKEGNVNNFV